MNCGALHYYTQQDWSAKGEIGRVHFGFLNVTRPYGRVWRARTGSCVVGVPPASFVSSSSSSVSPLGQRQDACSSNAETRKPTTARNGEDEGRMPSAHADKMSASRYRQRVFRKPKCTEFGSFLRVAPAKRRAKVGCLSCQIRAKIIPNYFRPPFKISVTASQALMATHRPEIRNFPEQKWKITLLWGRVFFRAPRGLTGASVRHRPGWDGERIDD